MLILVILEGILSIRNAQMKWFTNKDFVLTKRGNDDSYLVLRHKKKVKSSDNYKFEILKENDSYIFKFRDGKMCYDVRRQRVDICSNDNDANTWLLKKEEGTAGYSLGQNGLCVTLANPIKMVDNTSELTLDKCGDRKMLIVRIFSSKGKIIDLLDHVTVVSRHKKVVYDDDIAAVTDTGSTVLERPAGKVRIKRNTMKVRKPVKTVVTDRTNVEEVVTDATGDVVVTERPRIKKRVVTDAAGDVVVTERPRIKKRMVTDATGDVVVADRPAIKEVVTDAAGDVVVADRPAIKEVVTDAAGDVTVTKRPRIRSKKVIRRRGPIVSEETVVKRRPKKIVLDDETEVVESDDVLTEEAPIIEGRPTVSRRVVAKRKPAMLIDGSRKTAKVVNVPKVVAYDDKRVVTEQQTPVVPVRAKTTHDAGARNKSPIEREDEFFMNGTEKFKTSISHDLDTLLGTEHKVVKTKEVIHHDVGCVYDSKTGKTICPAAV